MSRSEPGHLAGAGDEPTGPGGHPLVPPAPKTMVSELSDAQLVVQVARYHQEALAEIYRRHGGAVLAMASRVLADRKDAEDVVQEVMVALWQAPDRFDPDRGSLRTYLVTRAHGRAVDIVRSRVARQRREEVDARHTANAGYDLELEVSDLVVAEQVRRALDGLSPDERTAIELAYFGGRSYREVAELLSEPEGTVKSRIRAGLRRMRSALVEHIEVPQ